MTLGSRFRQTITVMVDRKINSADQRSRIAHVARENLAQLVSSGRASPSYSRFVDGARDAPEENVKLNQGNITYLFSNLSQAVGFALGYLVARSPESSGRFKNSWFIIVNGAPWTDAIAQIPASAQVIISNREPYARKIDSGGMKMSVPPGIIEAARQEMQRRYPILKVDRAFINIPGGRDGRGAPVPYILRGRGHESGITYDKKLGYGRKRASKPARAKDRKKGSLLTYPALIFSERTQ